jgi:hypothetical protein
MAVAWPGLLGLELPSCPSVLTRSVRLKTESPVMRKSILLLVVTSPARSGASSASEPSTANETAQMVGLREVGVDEFLLER